MRSKVEDRDVEYGRVMDVVRIFGLSRSRIYILMGAGLIRAVKDGSAVLIELESVRDFMRNLPPADIQVKVPLGAYGVERVSS